MSSGSSSPGGFRRWAPAYTPPPRKAGTPSRRPAGKVDSFLVGLAVVIAIVTLLLVLEITGNPSAALGGGNGAVKGRVLDVRGRPLQADIFVEGTTIQQKTDANGRFLLKDVPPGQQYVVAAYQGMGKEIPIRVWGGTTMDIGSVKLESTALP